VRRIRIAVGRNKVPECTQIFDQDTGEEIENIPITEAGKIMGALVGDVLDLEVFRMVDGKIRLVGGEIPLDRMRVQVAKLS
jgi:hypothetical protein